MTCETCRKLNEWFRKHNPDRKGVAFCMKCIEEQGIVPLKSNLDDYHIGRRIL